MSKPETPVTVQLRSGSEAVHGWATSATVSRAGDLRVYQGLKQRVFYPAGEWLSYAVRAPAAVS